MGVCGFGLCRKKNKIKGPFFHLFLIDLIIFKTTKTKENKKIKKLIIIIVIIIIIVTNNGETKRTNEINKRDFEKIIIKLFQ